MENTFAILSETFTLPNGVFPPLPGDSSRVSLSVAADAIRVLADVRDRAGGLRRGGAGATRPAGRDPPRTARVRPRADDTDPDVLDVPHLGTGHGLGVHRAPDSQVASVAVLGRGAVRRG